MKPIIKANFVTSTFGDFASISVTKSGCVSFSVYPLDAADLRQIAADCIACAAKLERVAADEVAA